MRMTNHSVLHILFFALISACVTTGDSKSHHLIAQVEKNRARDDYRALSSKGMVVAAHPLASQAGTLMLERGGNAIDAAVAASFVISVVRPQSTGLGGGGFMLYFNHADHATKVYDFRERAPKASTKNMYYDANGKPKKVTYNNQVLSHPERIGHLSVAVPGLVKGLVEAQRKHGKLTLAEVMAPAIQAAALGFRVYPTLANSLDEMREDLARYESSSKIFFKDGRPLREGELLVQKDLAETLTSISEQGDAVFYQGAIAEKIIAEMQRGRGIIQQQDMSGYTVMERKPLMATYRGYQIATMPPPSSGGIHVIEMLNMLEQDDLKSMGFGSPEYLHLLTEVMRRAFADRAVYLGDPDFVKVPTATLTSKEYAQTLRSSIRKDRASVSTELRNPEIAFKESSSTTHLSVVDQWGNAVSTTQTINYHFGSCVVADGTGVVLNNEMDDFATQPGAPNVFGLVQGASNAVAPGKTPLSSMSPTIVFDRQGDVHLVVGSPGGPLIITAVLQTMIHVMDFNMSLLDAVHSYRIHNQWLPDQISYEKGGLSAEAELGLRNRGHVLMPRGSMGEVQAIIRTADGGLEGVADARSEGRAVGQR